MLTAITMSRFHLAWRIIAISLFLTMLGSTLHDLVSSKADASAKVAAMRACYQQSFRYAEARSRPTRHQLAVLKQRCQEAGGGKSPASPEGR
jgi:hypothetical protein